MAMVLPYPSLFQSVECVSFECAPYILRDSSPTGKWGNVDSPTKIFRY